ncbi:uncharacterized protein A4U43_C04F1470 [Asparagus officinalis]|uniref:NAC domain-containing protein n=1 Tax=Asparagus officinalis TaxID=4686 RepID=A0A5P1F251_ASPOF|nr:uncharacterized protein A4U43_C04F1470 [Asparagus officinalis]
MANQEDRFLSPLAISFDGEEEREPERLPVGFKFRPTDEELIQDYLRPKVLGGELPCEGIIVDTNIYHHDPTQLAETYADHEKSWYFFTPRNRKYEKGSRPDRAASGGFWKATAADIAIEKKEGDRKIKLGDKTALGFWETKKSRVRSIDRGTKTEWLMYEYKIEESKQPIKNGHMLLDDYVLSKIYRSCRKGWKKAAPVAVNPDNLQEQIQQPNKRARHQPEPERKPEPNFDPTQIQPVPDNLFLPNPETVQDENAYMFQNQSLQTALWNPNQPPDPLDHNFASSSDDNFFPDLPDFDFPLDFDQHEPANYQSNSPLPQGYNGESSIQPGMANFNVGVHGQDFQQLQINNYGVANFNIGVHGQNSQQLQYNYGDIHSPAQFLATQNSEAIENGPQKFTGPIRLNLQKVAEAALNNNKTRTVVY